MEKDYPRLIVVSIIMSLFLWNPACLFAMPTENTYVGAQVCRPCHQKEYEQWEESGHARILHKPTEAERINISYPSGYSRHNISYIIGGYKWKALFLDRNGYLITSTQEGDGKNQFNLRSKQWGDYLPGQKVFYDCGRCHTTGFSAEGHQNGLEGIIGRWKFEGVQCEACHGPGRKHVGSGLKADIVINAGVCINCHGKKPLDEIPLKGVFLQEYTEANQLLKSSMGVFSCTVCHNPHQSSLRSILKKCESCHQETAIEYKGSFMELRGVGCIDCHMPLATVIAEGNPAIYKGDFRSHLFRIGHRKDFPALEKDGRKINTGYLSVDYSCMPCHYPTRDRAWAVRFGMFAHTISITTDTKIMSLQRMLTYSGFLFAFLALLTGLNLKNYLLASLQLTKKKVLTFHRFSAWTTFSIFMGNVILCLFFHFPLEQPLKALDYGWFLIHPINSILIAAMYAGKIITVRTFRKGWTSWGLLWGICLFFVWLIQLGTIVSKS